MMEVVKGRNNPRKTNSSSSYNNSPTSQIIEEGDMGDLRRGPWTVEEDFKLINYIASHGEGRWNSLARCADLKRTGKSCRLRWLNYLRPDVRRGNITLEEQLMILELHSRWGNRWSKIAQHLPGRTDNEIKNYWRTRVQKHAKQLKCDVNSKQFKDAMRYLWMPRLMERIQAAAAASSTATTTTSTTAAAAAAAANNVPTCGANNNHHLINNTGVGYGNLVMAPNGVAHVTPSYTPENSASSDSFGTQVSTISDLTADYNYHIPVNQNPNPDYFQAAQVGYSDSITSPAGYFGQGLEFQAMDQNSQWLDGGDASDNLWNVEDMWFLQQQLNNNNNNDDI